MPSPEKPPAPDYPEPTGVPFSLLEEIIKSSQEYFPGDDFAPEEDPEAKSRLI